MTVRELLDSYTKHFVKCQDCKITQACSEGLRLYKVYEDAFNERQRLDLESKAKPPTPHQLWKQAGGDQKLYGELLVKHGLAVVREPLSLWVIMFYSASAKYTLQRQPIDEKIAHGEPITVESVDEARGRVPESHTRTEPEPGDDPRIVESWVPNELL